jgi:hypothetical protein
MRHVLESNDPRLNIDGASRRYYAADYQLGACVVHSGVTYQVRDCDGVAMFVATSTGGQ